MKPDKPLDPEILERLRVAYDSATVAERVSGLEWYSKAHAYAADLARRYGYTVPQVSAVLAALSPGASWDVNMRHAEILLDHVSRGVEVPMLGVYGRRNVEKAIAALAMVDPLPLFPAKSGPKTRAFYLAILDAVDGLVDPVDKIVIDRHAASAALDARGKLGGSAVDRVSPVQYRYLARHYAALAVDLGVDAWQVQAVIWNAWRKPVPGTAYKVF